MLILLDIMFLTVHASIGGLIGERFAANQWLAFVFGFLSHFVFDAIPHGDKVDINKKNKQSLYLVVAFDFMLVFILMLIWLYWFNLPDGRMLLMGMFGALLPDGLWGIYEQLKIKKLKFFYKFHNYIHNIFDYQISRKKAFTGQMLIVILSLAIQYLFLRRQIPAIRPLG